MPATQWFSLLAELLRARANGVGFQRRKFHPLLVEHIHNRRLTAEGIAPGGGVHLDHTLTPMVETSADLLD